MKVTGHRALEGPEVCWAGRVGQLGGCLHVCKLCKLCKVSGTLCRTRSWKSRAKEGNNMV